MCSPRFNEIRKSESQIAEGNDGVGPNHSIAGLLQYREQQLKVLLTELGTAAKEVTAKQTI